MAVKGSATVTLSQYRDTESVTRYYKLQSSSMAAPDKPANVKPNETPAGWSKSEPACDITKTLYTCDVTVFSDKTTHVSDVSKSTSYEAAKEAWNKANNAQGTADKAQSSADKAQNTATEAAKTADNYISTDSTGIMVSENKGATKETPSNATKNNVLITEKDVQIRNGRKILASYGKNTVIGDLSGSNIRILPNSIELNDGLYAAVTMKTNKTAEETVRTNQDFDGQAADNTVIDGKIWTDTFILIKKANAIKSVVLTGKAADFDMEIPDARNAPYGYELRNNELTIYLDGSYGETRSYEWFKYTDVKITYTTAEKINGVITSDEINGAECNATKVQGVGKLIAGQRYCAYPINGDVIRFVVGNGKDPLQYEFAEESNAAAITENGDLRLAGDVYINCNNDSTGGVPLGTITSGTGKITLTTGAVEYQPRWWRCGNIVQMEVGTKCTGKVASGANIAAGKITRVPKPITESGVRAVSYYGNNANISYMGSDGTFYARNAGADALEKGNDCIGGFTYITDGTML